MTDLLEIIGSVALREFEASPAWAREETEAWLRQLPELSDAELLDASMALIHESAFWNSRSGNHEHVHAKCSATYHEAERRKVAEGHAEDCRARTIYSVAHARVMREAGYTPSPLGACSCGLEPRLR